MVLNVLCAEAVSKQVVAKRIWKSRVEFLKQMLALLLCRQLRSASTELLFAAFNRVLLHDRSTLPLPHALAVYYPGAGNQRGRNAQAILDIKSRSYIYFSLTPFTRNDQTASSDILGLLQPGDLIIRDRLQDMEKPFRYHLLFPFCLAYQIESLIYAQPPILILLFHTTMYSPLFTRIDRQFTRKLSLLKLSAFFVNYLPTDPHYRGVDKQKAIQ